MRPRIVLHIVVQGLQIGEHGAARYQQLSLNPGMAGQCGKLKCRLNFELDQYVEAVKESFSNAKIRTPKGKAVVFKMDIFKRLVLFAVGRTRGFHCHERGGRQ